ncbi:cysteine hydrolase [Streptomyces palmae]|uniref:Cysteine hydrolase n=1 Tax=Streptomyces palmae TaxID=1701085 RepID=A0A4Z0HEV1_9ACTN|nr:cysteine hydrolase [Streptomyces palmae]TGB17378.1 cysteine hydrolase [Streptomyces palmae]
MTRGPASPDRLTALLTSPGCALLTVECQRGVVGPDSALPELAAAVRDSGALGRIARLVEAAHRADVPVLHAVAERRPDGRGSGENAPLLRAAARLPVRQLTGSAAVRIAEEIPVGPADLVVRRLHGLSPLAGTEADALLRNLGCRTLVIAGVSANVAVPNAVFDAVNLGYTAVLPADAIAGVPAEYTAAMIRHTLALVATVTTTAELCALLGARRASPGPGPGGEVGPVGPDALTPDR